jgi:SAM-dependent methyltransferase
VQQSNPNRALWEKGDFTQIAQTTRQSGDELVETLAIEPGMKVLDLGCGDGTTALPEARRGADVLGVDIAVNLVDAGSARARAAGLDTIEFRQGDASNLEGIADESFDLVVSIFGAMFAPRPGDVAKEMVRVTRPGGRIVMGNWIPGDPTLVAQILKISSAYTPPPPEGFVSPMTWGDQDIVRERFEAAGIAPDDMRVDRATWYFRHDGQPSELVAIFRDYYGPTMNAFEAARNDGRESQLEQELTDLFDAQNRGGDRTEIPATFLKVAVRKG